jgi:hypothetical protein
LEGASGGALGIGVGDKVYMMETLGILLFLQSRVLLFYGKAGNIKNKLPKL